MAKLNDEYEVLPEFLLKFIMWQVFLAISFLHANKAIHRHIKMENIAFVYKGNYKTKKEFDKFFNKIFKDKDIQNELNNASCMVNLSDEAQSMVKELCNYEIKLLDFCFAKIKKEIK